MGNYIGDGKNSIKFISSSGDSIPILNINIYYEKEYLGHVKLVPRSIYMYEIHISHIEKKFSGKALQTAKELYKYIFSNIKKIDCIIAMIPTEHRLAIALAKRSGMSLVGVVKKSHNKLDQEVFQIHREDVCQ